MIGRVFCEEAYVCGVANRAPFFVRHVEGGKDVRRRTGEDDFAGFGEEIGEAVPNIRDDGGGAGGGFEQADAGAVAGGDHVCAGHVQGETLVGVEGGVVARGQMFDTVDIGGPVDRGGVLRAGDDEAAMRGKAGGFQEEHFQRRLAVCAVGAEIAEIPTWG